MILGSNNTINHSSWLNQSPWIQKHNQWWSWIKKKKQSIMVLECSKPIQQIVLELTNTINQSLNPINQSNRAHKSQFTKVLEHNFTNQSNRLFNQGLLYNWTHFGINVVNLANENCTMPHTQLKLWVSAVAGMKHAQFNQATSFPDNYAYHDQPASNFNHSQCQKCSSHILS